MTQPDSKKIEAINDVIQTFFISQRTVDEIRAKDLMPYFISAGIFPGDHREGLPIRNLLRQLDRADELDSIPFLRAERKTTNTNWYFVRPPQYTYVWEYRVREDEIARFLEAYRPDGLWVRLFRGSQGYIRTELMRDVKVSNRFVTVDYWESRYAWERFRTRKAYEFETLDRQCEGYTLEETHIGDFMPVI